jgi:hypothetical protein
MLPKIGFTIAFIGEKPELKSCILLAIMTQYSFLEQIRTDHFISFISNNLHISHHVVGRIDTESVHVAI